ncbi:uncharacterized protein wu:fk95d07 isoform X2 [Osmerus mordax]|uniref:uncharacterized protein wu:fk95d07 isoform X2 n=1 Tax=Osmerus mordax TaxID=8014 RepID=UPI003510A867
MRSFAVLMALLSVCLAAPVEQVLLIPEEHERVTPIGPPQAQASNTIRTIYYPVPRPETALSPTNPYYNYPFNYPNPNANPYNLYPSYPYPSYPSSPYTNPFLSAYTLPPIVISLPKLN